MDALQNELAFIFDDPFHGFAGGEFHGLGHGGGEVDEPLFTVLSFDALNFGVVSHALRLPN